MGDREYIAENDGKRAIASYLVKFDWWVINCQNKKTKRLFYLITQYEDKAKEIADEYIRRD